MWRKRGFIRMVVAGLLSIGTAVGVIAGTSVAPASAETPSCGSGCSELFSAASGSGQIFDVQNAREAVDTPIVLDGAANTNEAEDFKVSFQGTVSDFVTAGLVSDTLSSQYGNDPGLEFQYSPFGVDSGLCVGVAATATQNEQVSLQPCGVNARTVWFVDASTSMNSSFPLINGSDTDSSNPFVLTDPMSSGAALTTTNLQSPVPGSQMWSGFLGALPHDDDLSLAQPANITNVNATSPSGAVVTYSLPTVSDGDDTTLPTPSCAPISGSTFAIGTTTVNCSVSNSDDTNSPQTSFTVTVLGAPQELAALQSASPGKLLPWTVGLAASQLAQGHPKVACFLLKAYIFEVQLSEFFQLIPVATANQLIASAKNIEAVIPC